MIHSWAGKRLTKLFALILVLLSFGSKSILGQDEGAVKGLRVLGAISLPDQKPSVGSKVYLLKVGRGAFNVEGEESDEWFQ